MRPTPAWPCAGATASCTWRCSEAHVPGTALATRSGALHTAQVQTRFLGHALAAACAGMLLAACGGSSGTSPPPATLPSPDAVGSSAPGGPATPAGSAEADAAAIVERALAARTANVPTEFAALLAAASEACPDPDAGRRLGEVAAIAARWSAALLDGRPKAQKVTEEQLAAIDWGGLVAPCASP